MLATVEQHVAAMHPAVRALVVCGFRELTAAEHHGLVFAARSWKSTDGGLTVIASVDEVMGAEWLHLSMSRPGRMPTYEDLARVKRLFIGDTRVAYQVFPRRTEHVNVHAFCLHLWSPLGADPFPDDLGERQRTVGP